MKQNKVGCFGQHVCGNLNNRSKESGVALISVLVTVAIILVTLSTLFYRNQLMITRATYEFTNEQVVLLALSSESWWLKILAEDLNNSDSDNLTETWAFPSPTMPVNNGQLTACLIDLQSKLNLNNLLRYELSTLNKEIQNNEYGLAVQVFRLFSDLGYDDVTARVASLHDWLDADTIKNSFGGAEDDEYLKSNRPRYSPNRALVSIDEVSSVNQFEVIDVPFIKSYFSALPKTTSVNINTSSHEVLAALLNETDDNSLQTIIDYRPYEDIDDFYQKLVDLNYADTIAEIETTLSADIVSIKTDFFQLNSMIELGDVRLVVQSLIYRPADNISKVLQRKFVTLPKLLDANGKQLPTPELCNKPSTQGVFI